ncbi:MAG: hypothetical protein HEQ23_12565 [Tepidisphaera sp.]
MIQVLCTLVAAQAFEVVTHQSESESLRCRAWVTMLAIDDESVRTAEWEDRITVQLVKGGEFDFVKFDAIKDDFGNLRISGRERFIDDAATKSYQEVEILANVIDGVSQWHRPSNQSAVVGPEDRSFIQCNMLPGLLTGLGRSLDFKSMRSQSDMLLLSKDLRIESEQKGKVVLRGQLSVDGRLMDQRVSIDAETGLVQKHDFINASWGHVFASWRVPEWQTIDGIRVPLRTEYELSDQLLTSSDRTALSAARKEAGLPSDAITPGSPRFSEWVRIREKHFAANGGAAPSEPSDWQYAITQVKSLNTRIDRSRFRIVPQVKPELIMNAAFECKMSELSMDMRHAVPLNKEPNP